MTIDDIRDVLDDKSLASLDVTRRLGRWKGQEFDLRLNDWTFQDWRPRDEWFSIHGQVTGRERSLRLFIQDGGRLDAIKKERLFEFATQPKCPPIRVHAVVPDGNSTLSTGLFLDILDYSVEVD